MGCFVIGSHQSLELELQMSLVNQKHPTHNYQKKIEEIHSAYYLSKNCLHMKKYTFLAGKLPLNILPNDLGNLHVFYFLKHGA